ncbi:PREDICTED: leucine-rich repeat-containing protein 40-like [Ceratosolen solmsi marchali]|uniref:Leucine-rich repeat-containing protein 40-like n=1 Tax=Ceratosolen solmsi marchali TaxID=326594 RepID=A0AAJ6YIA7_9HYME|nr:PREDICTED: leucine-rich repeat-containing protein 40-like [Ceratosolen solmsi marchali]
MSAAKRLINNASVFRLRTRAEDNAEISTEVIVAARRTGKLSLSSRALTSVPDRIWTINELTEEELRNVQVDIRNSDNQAKWWEYETLKSLDLSSNSLAKLSEDVKYLADIINLDIHDNLLETIPNEIGCLVKLRKLNLSTNKLRILPSKFFNLAELRCLDLKNNLIEELSPDIGNLVMLEYLNLSSNKLTSLPTGLGYLVRLITLELNHNRLKELPPDVMSMRALKKLDVSNNRLEIIHPLGELRRIERLDFHMNNLSSFPDVSGCTSLQEIYLSHNSITEINVNYLESLGQLKILNLNNNEIDAIPDEIILLINVEQLDLSYNNISAIPGCVGVMPNLQNFIIDGNNVKNIRRDIVQCGTPRIMKHLRQTINPTTAETANSPLRSCCTDNYPDKYAMRNAKLLSLVGQNLAEVSEEILENAKEAEVTCVDLSRNKLQRLSEKMSLVITTTDLKLSYNMLVDVPEWIGEKLTRLRYLDLSKNLLTSLPNSISSLQYLMEINISFNKFEELPECVCEILSLEILIANDNKMSSINVSALSKLKRLANLDLSNNNIGHIPPELGNIKNLRMLSLNGNCFKQPRQATLMKGTEEVLAYLRNRIPTQL